jgi:hypothetical protein
MKDLKKEYIQYLILLYRLEEENGIVMGDYPEFDEWLIIREEEAFVWDTIH